MKKQNLSRFIQSIRTSLTNHSPEILTGIGIGGMLTTIVLAVKATPKAVKLIELERDIREENDEPDLTKVDAIKTTWKCYIPAAITGTLSTACIIGAQSVNLRRNAALATAYSLSETAMKEYKNKVIETIGEEKEKEVTDAIAKDKIENHPVSTREIIFTEKGNILCYDAVSDRYFKSDKNKLDKAINELNYRMMSEMYISANDFYYEIGLGPTAVGDELGWNIDYGIIKLEYSSQITEDGDPCLVINYNIAPRYDYRRLL